MKSAEAVAGASFCTRAERMKTSASSAMMRPKKRIGRSDSKAHEHPAIDRTQEPRHPLRAYGGRLESRSGRHVKSIHQSLLLANPFQQPVPSFDSPRLTLTTHNSELSSSVHFVLQRLQKLCCDGVVRRLCESALELQDGLGELSARRPQTAQVQVGEVPRFVTKRSLGLLEPGDGFVELALFHQVTTDVVVRVAEGRVRRDRLAALFNRVVQAAGERVGHPRNV